MPVTNWTTTYIDGKAFLVIDVAKFRIPLDWDPSSNMFIAVAAPDGGIGGFPALVQGDDGVPPDLDTTINFTALAWDDPTADSASFTELSENLYRLNLVLHNGPPGDTAAYNLLDADDITGSPVAKKILVVSTGAAGFEYQSQKVGDIYWPASFNSAPSGNPSYTIGQVGIPAQPFDWRPDPSGWCVVTGTSADLRVDLIARLNVEASGNIVGRGRSHTGQNLEGFSTHLTSGPPPASADAYNRVAAGAAATIFFRVERIAGAATFTTTATDTYLSVKVQPIP